MMAAHLFPALCLRGGPPRAEIQGPNRAVSKLQLLRCGNDYIRQLLRMVGRRDDYIEGMKTEIKALRALVSEDADKVDKLKEIEDDGLGNMRSTPLRPTALVWAVLWKRRRRRRGR